MNTRCEFLAVNGNRCPMTSTDGSTRPGELDGHLVVNVRTNAAEPFAACRLHAAYPGTPSVAPEVVYA